MEIAVPGERYLGQSYSEFLGAMMALSPGYSQRQMASYIGIGEPALSQYLSGKRAPGHDSMDAIEVAFDLIPEETEWLRLSTKRQKLAKKLPTSNPPEIDLIIGIAEGARTRQLSDREIDVARFALESLRGSRLRPTPNGSAG